jgi:5''-3'' exonuclease (including N-terminal domain of PolI)
MKLLIDADFIVYKCCAACETEIDYGEDVILVTSNFSEAYSAVKREISNIQMQFGSFAKPTLFFSDSKNFRKKIFPDYKGHRNRKKPCGYKRVISGLKIEYDVIVMPQLEADDAMGIFATKFEGNIIVSPDKDMRQIPGKLYNLEDTTTITPEEGAKWHLIQTLAGDQTDGYSGVPGIGVKRATTLFQERRLQLGYSCSKLLEDKGLTETGWLSCNARLARILTNQEYDSKSKNQNSGHLPPSTRLTPGTGV